MKTNKQRIEELTARPRPIRYSLGQLVREPYGSVGAIDKIYVDYEAVLDDMCFPRNWYEVQNRRPKTPKSGVWYSVILPDGAVLAGEDDLEAVAQ